MISAITSVRFGNTLKYGMKLPKEHNVDTPSDNMFVVCDRCGCEIDLNDHDNSVEEDGLIYCKQCYTKLLEQGDI